MIVLAIDTALAACSAAILDNRGREPRVFARSEPMLRGHAEALMPLLDKLLAEAEITLADVGCFAATVGPGTFTGVRVGVAVVRGFALATGRPAVGVATLAALAETARSREGDPVPLLVAVDARRGEIYAQSFAADGRALTEPTVGTVSTVLETLPPQIRHVFGTAAARCAEEAGADRLGNLGTASAPDPAAVGRLALVSPALSPAPLYLRPPDAKPQSAAAIQRQ